MGYVVTSEDFEQLNEDLEDFITQSEARTVLLCDRGGNVIASSGEAASDNMDMVSALVAGSFAATKQLALVLGEQEFSAVFHQGSKISIFISGVDEEVLFLALFSDETNAGLVKMYALKTCRKFSGLFEEIMTREQVKFADPTQSFKLSKGPVFG